MKRTLFLLIFLIVALNCQSQDKYPFNWTGNSFIDSLKSTGVTKIVSFKEYFPGAKILFDNPELACDSEDIYYDLYIVWVEKGVTNFKRFNNCFEFSTQRSDTIKLFDFIAKNKETIKVENQQIEKRKKNKTLTLLSHSNRIELNIFTDGSQNSYYVDEAVVTMNDKVYVNFENSKLFELINILKGLSQLEFEKVK
jgi:hypothetical protein